MGKKLALLPPRTPEAPVRVPEPPSRGPHETPPSPQPSPSRTSPTPRTETPSAQQAEAPTSRRIRRSKIFETPEQLMAKKAKRNADAYTAFRVTGAISTALFLGAGVGAVYSGVKYLKFMGMEKAMNLADSSADTFFDETGNLTRDSKQVAESVPELMPLLHEVEKRAKKEDGNVHDAIDEISEGVSDDKKKWKKITVGTGIAAGAGVVGMIIFLTAAGITKHRGNMLYSPRRGRRFQAKVTPEVSPGNAGIQISGKF